MNIKLLDKPNPNISPRVQVCINRGIPIEKIRDYLRNSEDHIYEPEAFDEELLKDGARLLIRAINAQQRIHVIQDCDVDGMTSAAILINYLYELFPSFVEKNVSWSIHEGKAHGLGEFIDTLEKEKYGLVICPDSATNDHKEIERLHNVGTNVLILDHHLSEVGFSPYAVTINSQYGYPNEFLCGGGVVYKFCKYLDKILCKDIADKFIDLVAIAEQSDMMDIRNLETKELIFKGLTEEAIQNPLIFNICMKNEFAMNKADYVSSAYNHLKVTPMAISFFCTPLLNSVCRSGTKEEKELTFQALLTHRAFVKIPSTKRGHKLNELETIVTQVTRQVGNIKNRQERSVEAGMALLEQKASLMMDHKVMLFTLEPNDMEPTIRGLCANKLMAKYQRPVAVTTKLADGTYAGSMRGYTATGINSFKEVAERSDACTQVIGHANAAGIFITDPDQFLTDMDKELSDVSTEITYYVDYVWDTNRVDSDIILDLASMNDYLGTGFERPQVFVQDIDVSTMQVMKSNTLKFTSASGVGIIMFGATDEQIEEFSKGGKINFVCKCNANSWNGNTSGQLLVIDYEYRKPTGIEAWGF